MSLNLRRFAKIGPMAATITLLAFLAYNQISVQAGPLEQGTPPPTVPAGPTGPATPAAPALEPGAPLGTFILGRPQQPDPTVLTLLEFCTYNPPKPKLVTAVCDVPGFTRIYLEDGIRASDQAGLDAEWPLVSWDVYVDEQKIDLQSFATFDSDVQVGAVTLKTRKWLIELDSNTAGKHTYRTVFHASQAVSDPINGKLAAGSYTFSAKVNIGSDNFSKPCPSLIPPSGTQAAPVAATQSAVTGTGPAYLGAIYSYTGCGVKIEKVIAGGPAAKAKLRVGDVILAVNGVPIIVLPAMVPIPTGSFPGTVVTYTVSRGGIVTDFQVTLEVAPATPVATQPVGVGGSAPATVPAP